MRDRKNRMVTVTIGLPGSGKSTWAKEQIQKRDNVVRVGRDDFRFMLKNAPMLDFKLEKLITRLQKETIIAALVNGNDVIVDNTHCQLKYLNMLIKDVQHYADVEFMYFPVPPKKCIERDAHRERSVGEAVIMKMHNDLKSWIDSFDFSIRKKIGRPEVETPTDPEKINAYLFDIDGTIALMRNRGPFDWLKVDRDAPNIPVIETLKALSNEYCIVLMSGRDSAAREKTEEWLSHFEVPYDELWMRAKDDFRKDSVIKKELYMNHIKDRYNILGVFDDRLQVMEMWDEIGLFTFNVNQGNIEF